MKLSVGKKACFGVRSRCFWIMALSCSFCNVLRSEVWLWRGKTPRILFKGLINHPNMLFIATATNCWLVFPLIQVTTQYILFIQPVLFLLKSHCLASLQFSLSFHRCYHFNLAINTRKHRIHNCGPHFVCRFWVSSSFHTAFINEALEGEITIRLSLDYDVSEWLSLRFRRIKGIWHTSHSALTKDRWFA